MRRTSQPPPPRLRPMSRRRGAETKQLTNIKKVCPRRLEQQRLWTGCPLTRRTSDELVLERRRAQGGCAWSFLDSTNNIYPASNGLRQLSHLGSVMWILVFLSNILEPPPPLWPSFKNATIGRAKSRRPVANCPPPPRLWNLQLNFSHSQFCLGIFCLSFPSDKQLDLKILPLSNETSCLGYNHWWSYALKRGKVKSSWLSVIVFWDSVQTRAVICFTITTTTYPFDPTRWMIPSRLKGCWIESPFLFILLNNEIDVRVIQIPSFLTVVFFAEAKTAYL